VALCRVPAQTRLDRRRGDHRHEPAVGGETVESADVLSYNGNGKLVAFDTLGDPTLANRVFAT
jgi:hypothetical protein